jgi:hypothetical protein
MAPATRKPFARAVVSQPGITSERRPSTMYETGFQSAIAKPILGDEVVRG